jgi:hypothetical protein
MEINQLVRCIEQLDRGWKSLLAAGTGKIPQFCLTRYDTFVQYRHPLFTSITKICCGQKFDCRYARSDFDAFFAAFHFTRCSS